MLRVIHFSVEDTYYEDLFPRDDPIENNMPFAEFTIIICLVP